MFLRLPNELIGMVLGNLPRRDLFNVALCSRLLHTLVIPILYSNVELPVAEKFNPALGTHVTLVDEELMQLLQYGRKYGKYIRRIRVVPGERGEAPNVEEEKIEIDENSQSGGLGARQDNSSSGSGRKEASSGEHGRELEEEDAEEGGDEEEEGDQLKKREEGGREEEGSDGDDEGEGEGFDDGEDDEEGDEGGEEDSEDESGGSSFVVEPRSSDTDLAIANQIFALMEIGETRLTSFKWLLHTEISPNLFQKLVEVPGNILSTLEILSHGCNSPAYKLPEGSLPCLRKLVVRGGYSPQRVAELHYILRASLGLQSFGFGIGEEASPEAHDFYFQFTDEEMAGIGFENDDFRWEEKPTHWTDFIENCIFKNLKNLPLRELMTEGFTLTSKMARLLPLDSLRHISLSGLGTSFAFIQDIDTQKLNLETCNIVYERVGELCLFRKFVGDLRPGLRHLGLRCNVWDADPSNSDHNLELEYPGLFSLPEEFTERQQDTLETMTFNVLIHDWQNYRSTPDHSQNFKISSEFSKLTELSVPLLTTKTKSAKKLPNGPIPGENKDFWVLALIPLDGITALPNLRVLTLNPISTEYRADFVESIFEENIHFKKWVDMHQELLVKYIEELVRTYGNGYGQTFGLDRQPPLEWIFVVGGEGCHLEVGFRIKWSRAKENVKYDFQTIILSGIEARKLIKTEDMRFRKTLTGIA
ncbi:uncharacterized protein DFL_005302 [Arthrobotrys flagrans]|uniref:F-box domain-containing protein n=1 Tax=Arthrobotrys flagrans TaxID=97331 RepID=A0A437A784_ARTFL|nr:hypothetical protein DFL_005302 [Arthrobotrys flagrans]